MNLRNRAQDIPERSYARITAALPLPFTMLAVAFPSSFRPVVASSNAGGPGVGRLALRGGRSALGGGGNGRVGRASAPSSASAGAIQ